MHKYILFTFVSPFLWACMGNMPPPTERLSDAKSAVRSAQELGANRVPDAQLSLKLANEQISSAEVAMNDGKNKRAHYLLIRAKADAELAVAQARENNAHAGLQEAVDDAAEQKTRNSGQGAVN